MKNLVGDARKLALDAHRNQMYGAVSYRAHLLEVVVVLIRHGIMDHEVHAAAWLHDVLEDTEVDMDRLDEVVGGVVTDMVCSVTDGPGKNRQERKQHMFNAINSSDDKRCLLVKLADRIANISHGDKRDMYVKEYPTFRKQLGHIVVDGFETQLQSLWIELDALHEWK